MKTAGLNDPLDLFHWTEREYNLILGWLRKSSRREKIAAKIVRGLPPLFFVVYALQLCLTGWRTLASGFAWEQVVSLTGTIVFPAGCLFISGLLRRRINRKRPYQQLSLRPLIDKKGGKSFPSNHTASAFVLAMTMFRMSVPVGCVMLVLAAITGLSRLAAGLHWPEDVLGGALLGMICGAAGLMIL